MYKLPTISMIGQIYTMMRSTLLLATICSIVLGAAVSMTNAVPVTNEAVWGEWSGWSNCSRTCGAGITSQTRTCLSGDCSDESAVQYRSCCIEDCPANTPDFREDQCKERTRNIDVAIDWVPSKQDEGECQLICVPKVSHDASTVPQGIITSYIDDGTPCMMASGVPGVCLGTMCAAVGCDNVLGSLKTLDKCQQCVFPDDDSNCEEHSGTFTSNRPDITGDVAVLNISSGARSILLSHPLKPNQGKLALKSATDSVYYFTGGPDGTNHRVSGAVFHYSLTNVGAYSVETLTSQGPITETITVQLLAVMHSTPEVDYTYHLLHQNTAPSDDTHLLDEHNPGNLNLSAPDEDDEAIYMWEYMSFSNCTVSCGTGLQTAYARCRDADYPDREIPNEICLAKDLPMPLPVQQKCNTSACPPRWVIGGWGECSQMCGGGLQSRSVQCQQLVEHGKTDSLVEEALCLSVPKPEDQRECNVEACPYTWSIGEWSECPVSCGNGTQTRSVVCIETATGSETHPSNCNYLIQPKESKSCILKPCLCYWYTPWKKCNNSCGYGIQERRVRCRYLDGNGRANDSCCEGLPLPELTRPCWDTRGKRCHVDWDTSEFGECKGNCCRPDEHIKERSVQCVAIYNERLIILPQEACNVTTKPTLTTSCQRTDCPKWSYGEFGECTTTCGEGERWREVTCVQNGDIVPNEECRVCTRPDSSVIVCDNQICIDSHDTSTSPPPPVCLDREGYEKTCDTTVSAASVCTEYLQEVCCGTCVRLNKHTSTADSTS